MRKLKWKEVFNFRQRWVVAAKHQQLVYSRVVARQLRSRQPWEGQTTSTQDRVFSSWLAHVNSPCQWNCLSKKPFFCVCVAVLVESCAVLILPCSQPTALASAASLECLLYLSLALKALLLSVWASLSLSTQLWWRIMTGGKQKLASFSRRFLSSCETYCGLHALATPGEMGNRKPWQQ